MSWWVNVYWIKCSKYMCQFCLNCSIQLQSTLHIVNIFGETLPWRFIGIVFNIWSGDCIFKNISIFRPCRLWKITQTRPPEKRLKIRRSERERKRVMKNGDPTEEVGTKLLSIDPLGRPTVKTGSGLVIVFAHVVRTCVRKSVRPLHKT